MRPAGAFEPLITAEEAYPALEKLAWEAERTIWMAFRIFEPSTALRNPDAAPAGAAAETWLDLLRQKLRQGVEVRIALADFDPIGAPELHQTAWSSAAALATIAGTGSAGGSGGGSLEVLPIRHEARIGGGWRYVRRRDDRRRQPRRRRRIGHGRIRHRRSWNWR